MSEQNIELKAGQLVVFSEGEYSDYGYRGTYVVLADVSADEMHEVAGVVKAEADGDGDDWNVISMVEPELIRRGKLAAIDLREIYLGAYGKLRLS